ncbi:MAG: ribosome silencing factor [Deferribacterota bacterium]|nr:ribosome silencing factor [Deferribacterota bacterium]
MKEEYILKKLYNLLEDKKSENIVIYQVSDVSYIADYLVICTASSEIHINAIINSILKDVNKWQAKIYQIDGEKRSNWVSIDFGFIILHIMSYEVREKYSLESIWGDCKKIDYKEYTDEPLNRAKRNY